MPKSKSFLQAVINPFKFHSKTGTISFHTQILCVYININICVCVFDHACKILYFVIVCIIMIHKKKKETWRQFLPKNKNNSLSKPWLLLLKIFTPVISLDKAALALFLRYSLLFVYYTFFQALDFLCTMVYENEKGIS